MFGKDRMVIRAYEDSPESASKMQVINIEKKFKK
jgi:hypothetical protein